MNDGGEHSPSALDAEPVLKLWQRLLSKSAILGLGLALLLFTAVLAFTASRNELFFSTDGKTQSDYNLWYSAGLLALSPDRGNIYNTDTLAKFWNVLCPMHNMTTADTCVFIYPPHFALLFSLFALLPLFASYSVWTLSTLAGGLSVLTLLLRERRVFTTWQIVIFILAALVIPPSLITIRIGQLSWFYVAIGGLYFYCFYRRRDWLAGFLLAILSTKPQYFVFFAVPAIVSLRWKMLAAVAIGGVASVVSSGLYFGWSNVIGYPSVLLHKEGTSEGVGVSTERMISLRLLFQALLPRAVGLWANVGTMAGALAGLAYLWFRVLKTRLDMTNWAIAITVLAAIVASPHSHMYDLLLLVVPAVVTLNTTNLFLALGQPSLPFRLWNCIFIAYALGLTATFFLAPQLFFSDIAAVVLSINVVLLGCAIVILWRSLKDETFANPTSLKTQGPLS